MPKIIRVFPREARWTPKDDMAFVGGPYLFTPEADEVHVSCTFSWDKSACERLAELWGRYYPTKLGGPAYDDPGLSFKAGMYVAKGYTITSRGCIHKCPFCLTHVREGGLRELPIEDGWIVEDSNLLACSQAHIEAVIDMLARQPEAIRLTGGLEAALLTPWFCEQLKHRIKLRTLYLAFDRPKDSEVFARATAMLRAAKIPRGAVRAYVLVGFRDDTPVEAERRLRWVFSQGATPFAMYYRPPTTTQWGKPPGEWAELVTNWTWDRVIFARMKRLGISIERSLFDEVEATP